MPLGNRHFLIKICKFFPTEMMKGIDLFKEKLFKKPKNFSVHKLCI